jgi:hypothetical protein
MRRGPPSALLLVVLAGAAPAPAATVQSYDPRAHRQPAAVSPVRALPERATPPDPPTSQPEREPAPEPGVDPDTSIADPLVGNGLGGALCRNAHLAGGLSAAARRNCATAGTAAASAPIGHYGFDIHIDTGAFGLSSRTLQSALQTLVLTPLWTLLVWLTHAALSLVEWAFAIDLLDRATMGSVAGALHSLRATVTEPWLVVLLALAAIALLYHGIVRRRVAESVGALAATTAMILAGLWIVTNPAGTVGEASRAINQTGLGAVAAVSAGDPAAGSAALGDGLRDVFASAVLGPWCYLEFGDVDWCRNPRRLDPDLATAARELRALRLRDARCDPSALGCADGAAERREAQLLGDARTNGELFLAFPANSPPRNAINDEGSLYRALCGNDDDNNCRGPGAGPAQWRTEAGTWPRAGGLVLIAVGAVGMLALLLFIALRLLGAAILTVVYLLLAPIAILAPAVGDGGRSAFCGWAVRLVGALLAKLIYALFLGVVLLALSLLNGMGSLGWWTQWLLVAAFWWIVFAHRDEVLAYARLGHTETAERGLRLAGTLLAARQLTRVAGEASSPVRRLTGHAGRTTARAARAIPERVRDHDATAARERSELTRRADAAADDDQVTRTLTAEHRAAAHRRERAASSDSDVAALDARRARLEREITAARAVGDRRRELRLADRERRLRQRPDAQRSAVERADRLLRRADDGRHAPRSPHDERDVRDRGVLLDREAAKRRGVPPGPRADRDAYRDYAGLAPLAGLTAEGYRDLAPPEQRRARLAIDRELDARRERAERRTDASDGTLSDQFGGGASRTYRPPRHAPESAADRRRRQLGRPYDGRPR